MDGSSARRRAGVLALDVRAKSLSLENDFSWVLLVIEQPVVFGFTVLHVRKRTASGELY